MITDKLLKLLGFLRFDIRENAWPGSNGSRTSWRSRGWRSRRVGNNSSLTNLAGCTAASPHLWKKSSKVATYLFVKKPTFPPSCSPKAALQGRPSTTAVPMCNGWISRFLCFEPISTWISWPSMNRSIILSARWRVAPHRPNFPETLRFKRHSI